MGGSRVLMFLPLKGKLTTRHQRLIVLSFCGASTTVPTARDTRMRRRKFLSLSATTVGGAVVYSVEQKAFGMFAPAKTPPPPLRFFTPAEGAIVVAATGRGFPT